MPSEKMHFTLAPKFSTVETDESSEWKGTIYSSIKKVLHNPVTLFMNVLCLMMIHDTVNTIFIVFVLQYVLCV